MKILTNYKAAREQWSKSFSKDIMTANRIPTAISKSFEQMDEALAYLDAQPVPIVVKADGLAQAGFDIATTGRKPSRRYVMR